MGERYEPPFTMTGEITNLIVEIGELVGAITKHEAMNPSGQSEIDKIRENKKILDEGVISKEEFEKKKNQLMNQ